MPAELPTTAPYSPIVCAPAIGTNANATAAKASDATAPLSIEFRLAFSMEVPLGRV